MEAPGRVRGVTVGVTLLISRTEIGCHVITVTHDILAKLNLVGKSLEDYSLDTVAMFFKDGQAAGYTL